MRTLTGDEVAQFRERGFLQVPGVFDAETIPRLRKGYDYIEEIVARGELREAYRTGKGCEVHLHVQAPEGVEGRDAVRYLRKVQWPAMIHCTFEALRTDARDEDGADTTLSHGDHASTPEPSKPTYRLSWSRLLARVFRIDVTECPHGACPGRS